MGFLGLSGHGGVGGGDKLGRFDSVGTSVHGGLAGGGKVGLLWDDLDAVFLLLLFLDLLVSPKSSGQSLV